jgi:hypothetical protein
LEGCYHSEDDRDKDFIIYFFRENYSTIITNVTISPVTEYDLEFVCFGYDVNGKKIQGSIAKIQLYPRGMLKFVLVTE